jgi:motility quorum-sensing regulator / GCU-specific mRNA interferase toxin
MEKLKPHFELKILKKLFCSVSTRIITQKARKNAVTMGYMSEDDMLAVISRLGAEHFYKSMTTYDNHKIWQDVYRYRDEDDNALYIKVQLTVDLEKAVLIQMKRDEGSDE